MSTKQAVSVTLTSDNLVWLRARAGAAGIRSVSELLDRLITNARAKGPGDVKKSVVGTIDVAAADPLLRGADEAIKGIYQASLGRPLFVNEKNATYRAPYQTGRPRRRRG